MGNQFASGRIAIAICDRCGFQYDLKELKTETVKTKPYKVRVCFSCWDVDHPQLQLGMYPIYDPQAIRDPRPDTTYITSGELSDGSLGGGSRDIQWGWRPVGGTRGVLDGLTPNTLTSLCTVSSVTVS